MPGWISLVALPAPHAAAAVLTLASVLPRSDLASAPLPPIHLSSDGFSLARSGTTSTSLPTQPKYTVSPLLVTSVMLPLCLIATLASLSSVLAAVCRHDDSLALSTPATAT